MPETLRVPYTQQFTPDQTPLRQLMAVVRQHAGNRDKLKTAIGAACFKSKTPPEKLAGNTLIALKTYGILDDGVKLTPFGTALAAVADDADAHRMLAQRILLHLDGVPLVETLRELRSAGQKIALGSLPGELRKRGFKATDSSSDLSGIFNWLREAGVLKGDYEIDEAVYAGLVGTEAGQIAELKGLTPQQLYFLRSMVALGIGDFTPYGTVAKHAEGLYPGQVRYNWKEIDRTVLRPLQALGLLELRRMEKSAPDAQGGKAAHVKPTAKLKTRVADALLAALAKAAGYADFREIASKSWADIVGMVQQTKDRDLRARGLELLTIKIALTLDLEFMGWRTTEEVLAAGGEVDAMLHAPRLIYSRWQIQCKAAPTISLEAVAKEVGLVQVTLANVIVVASTGVATKSAKTYRDQIVRTSNLNIVLLEGSHLKRIVADPACIVTILFEQAQNALRLKPRPDDLKGEPPTGGGSLNDDGSDAGPNGSGVKPNGSGTLFRPAYTTALGAMYQGDGQQVLTSLIARGERAKLIMTSPPFALLRKKAYGNEDADRYIEWFVEFAELFKQLLEPDGHLVIDIGGSWVRGLPVRSTYHFELLLRLCRSGFYLAQDFYHYNPARLPTPAEWVTIRRLRVKDAVNTVWWLVRDPFTAVDNRRVLRPYSDSMKDLIKRGYRAKLRPSGHDISTKFQKDNGGAIPGNLISLANTESNSHYLTECRRAGLAPHPARFPRGLPDFFIKFLTQPGDVVLDPFAGSNVTGEAAEELDRRWIGVEINPEYVAGSRFRFSQPEPSSRSQSNTEPQQPAFALSARPVPH